MLMLPQIWVLTVLFRQENLCSTCVNIEADKLLNDLRICVVRFRRQPIENDFQTAHDQ
jgi:hypothetical protein